jgi:single-strand DNA-binding protein
MGCTEDHLHVAMWRMEREKMNKQFLIGNLGGEVTLNYTANGQPVANFRVATNEHWTTKSGEKGGRTEWHRIVAWDKLGENCAQYLATGRMVFIEGTTRTRSYIDKKSGEKHYVKEIHASQVLFLDKLAHGRQGPQKTNVSKDVEEESSQAPDEHVDDGSEGEALRVRASDVPF